MGSINQIIDTAVALYKKSPRVVVDIVGKPGEGKSDASVQIMRKLGFSDDRSYPSGAYQQPRRR